MKRSYSSERNKRKLQIMPFAFLQVRRSLASYFYYVEVKLSTKKVILL